VPVVDRRSGLSVTSGLAVLSAGSLAYAGAFPVRLAVAAAMVAATFLLINGMLRIYVAALIRAHRSVVDRPEFGELRRWAIFGLAVVGWPLLVLTLLLGGIGVAVTVAS